MSIHHSNDSNADHLSHDEIGTRGVEEEHQCYILEFAVLDLVSFVNLRPEIFNRV